MLGGVQASIANGSPDPESISIGLGESLIEVSQDVVEVFDTHGEANEFGRDAGGGLLFLVHLRVGRGGGVNGEGLRVSDIGKVRVQLKGLDEDPARIGAPLDAEDDHGAALPFEILFVLLEFGVVGQSREANPFHGGVGLKVLGDREGVLAVTLHAEGKGLDALKKDPGIVRRNAGAEVSKRHGAHTQDEGEGSEFRGKVMAPTKSVIGAVRGVEDRVLSGGPIEATGVDHDAPDAGAVPAEPFGEGVHHDVCAVFKGTGEVGGREGRIDNEGYSAGVGVLGDCIQIGDLKSRVGNGLGEEGARFVVGGLGEIFGILRVDKANLDSESGEDVVELGVGAAIEISGGDNVVSNLGEIDDGVEDSRGAGGEGESRHFVGAFEQGDPCFENRLSGIHDAAVNVTKFFEGKEIGGVFGAVENVGSRSVDRDSAGVGGRVGRLAAVEADGVEFHEE